MRGRQITSSGYVLVAAPGHPAAQANGPAVIQIPGGCLNLAAAVNVVLYDRVAKKEVRNG